MRRTPTWASRGWARAARGGGDRGDRRRGRRSPGRRGHGRRPAERYATAPAGTTSAAPTVTEPPTELVTERFEVAGFTIAYRRPADQGPMTLHRLPAGLRCPTARDRSTCPASRESVRDRHRRALSGDGALYLRDGTRQAEERLAVVSPGVSAAELGELLADEAGTDALNRRRR